MINSVDLMQRIYSKMKSKKISISDMCEKVNIGEATFWRYKSGKKAPSVDLVIEMGRILDLSHDELFATNTASPTLPPARKAKTGEAGSREAKSA